ncbi:MAG TPA: chromate transporter [Bacilli bacterium]|nr:chromate transporter [Bacilli bacterium]
MLELLQLFWLFFKIGLFTFGGGYAMIPLMQSEIVGGGMIDAELFVDFIAISESTPGPFAVNMATFIGMNQAGFIGAMFTTLGVILPSFLIILLIASLGSRFLDSKYVKHAFRGLKPAVIGLVLSVALMLAIRKVLPMVDLKTFHFNLTEFDYKGLIIMAVILGLTKLSKKMTPIGMIVLSAILGLILYGII